MPQTSPKGSSLATLSEVPGTELRQLRATFSSFREFVVRYSPWLSDACIFVETLEAVPVGAPVRLEIGLLDQPLLVRALGQVDWVRAASEGDEDGPPGVALNINYLDPASARLIDSIFRLYTGQQSAAMGKDVVETWELDVESLIDQAFPGTPGPGVAPSGAAAPAAAAPAAAAPAAAAGLDAASGAGPGPLALDELDELDVPIELTRLEAPAELAAPAASFETAPPAVPAASAVPSVPPPAAAPVPAAPASGSVAPATEEDAAWEAKLSVAFSEHEAAEPDLAPLSVAPQDVGPTAAAEVAGFGFGLVEGPALTAAEAADEDLPPLEDDAETPAPEPAPAWALPAPVPAPGADLAAAAGPPARVAPSLAGAASAARTSDGSFLRRSVLAILLAVVAAGVLFIWFRGRQAAPSAGPTIAQGARPAATAPSGDGPPPAGAASPGAASPSAAPPAEEPPAEEPSSEPAGSESAVPPSAAPPSTPPSAAPTPAESASAPELGPAALSPPVPAPEVAAVPAPPAQDPAAIVEAVEAVLKAWADAWSEQQVAAYLECYAPDFSPPGTGHREWQRQRSERIRAPASLRVQAKDVSVKVLDARRAEATFYQDYEADEKHLYTWKTMELARLPAGWKIVTERVGR